jgi:hypothetical protein
LQSASQLASLLDPRSDMPFARLFPFGIIKQQGSGASFSEISSHVFAGLTLPPPPPAEKVIPSR